MNAQYNVCQRASDNFDVVAGVTWGAMPSELRSLWTFAGCSTVPRSLSLCEKLDDFYGITGSSYGFAPSDVQTFWSSNSCVDYTGAHVPSLTQLCQNAADMYGIIAGNTFGGAPGSVQTWWTASGCNATASCQDMSELFGIDHYNASYASNYVIAAYENLLCTTSPLFLPTATAGQCQRAADFYGIIANQTWGFAPSSVQTWWENNSCSAWPQSDVLREYGNGP